MVGIIKMDWLTKPKHIKSMSKSYDKINAREFLKNKMKTLINITMHKYKISNDMDIYNEVKNTLLVVVWRIYQQDNNRPDAYYYRCLDNSMKDIFRTFKYQNRTNENNLSIEDYNESIEDTKTVSEKSICNRVYIEKLEKHLSVEAKDLLINVYTYQHKKKTSFIKTESLLGKVKRSMDCTDKQLGGIVKEIRQAIKKVNSGIIGTVSNSNSLTALIKAEVG